MILRGNFYSEALHMSTNIQVMLPDKGAAPFRIVYLLHGMHGDQATWTDNTALPYYAKKYNAVFVMPEAGRSFYINLKYGRKYYDYVSYELPQVCKKFFNFSSRREDTAVMGCSMGAFGSLFLALTNPDQFGFCGSIAPACLSIKSILKNLRTDPEPWLKTGSEAGEIFTDIKTMFGEGFEYDPKLDICELIKNFPDDKPKPVIFASCGLEDDLREESMLLKDVIQDRNFNFTYEEWTGGHEWYFFNDALKKTIKFWYKGYEA